MGDAVRGFGAGLVRNGLSREIGNPDQRQAIFCLNKIYAFVKKRYIELQNYSESNGEIMEALRTVYEKMPDKIEIPEKIRNKKAEVIILTFDEISSESQKLRKAAQMLRDNYTHDEQLNAFKSLDGEDFYE